MTLRRLMVGRRTVRAMNAGGIALTPALILGAKLVLDLDGAVGVSTLAGKISAVTDQSPRGNSVSQPTAARRPIPGSNLNGYPGMNFTAASVQWLALLTGFAGIAAGDAPHAWVVASISGNTRALFELTDSAAVNRVMNLGQATPAFTTLILGGGAVNATATAAAAVAGAQRYEAFDNTSDKAELRVAGVAVTSAAATAGGLTRAPSRLTVGVLGDGTTWPLQGDIWRMLIASPAPTAAQASAIDSYLQTHYAIS